MEKVEDQKFKNPITGEYVDETIKEKEAVERGYFDFEFQLRYLEDENEYVKYFIINGKKIIVDMAKPHLQYKHKSKLNYERILSDTVGTAVPAIPNTTSTAVACSMDEGCESCSG